jgi:hypothetical protein
MSTRRTRTPAGRRRRAPSAPASLPVATATAWTALWATTALGAIAVTAGADVLRTPAPRDALDATLKTAANLATHNAIVALWPLALVALSWPSLPIARRLGDALIAAQLLDHGLVVGGALASQPAMWRYLPHLPAEWLALAAPAGTWATARTHPLGQPAQLGTAAATTLAAVIAAALLETYLVPL